mmetsp:Transcript_40876/g.112380  ORF Transcript_40876/g.112380 Transcript_40876/m.112380 type:complete len:96 (+) Transcript_40876:43-330(+)
MAQLSSQTEAPQNNTDRAPATRENLDARRITSHHAKRFALKHPHSPVCCVAPTATGAPPAATREQPLTRPAPPHDGPPHRNEESDSSSCPPKSAS